MTELPETWELLPVGEIAEVQGGIQKQQKRRPVNNKHPFLRVANISRSGLDLSEVHEIEVFDGELEKFALRPGDLLVVEGNGSPERIGRAAMWRGEISECVHQNHLIRVRPSEALLPKFLNLVWNAPITAEQLRRVASSTSGLYTLSTAKVKAVKIPVPPLAEQRRIVAALEDHLSRLEAGQESLNRMNRRLEALWLSVLNSVVSGTLLESEKPQWPRRAVDEVAEVKSGIQKQQKRRPVQNKFPFLRVANVPRGGLDLTEVHEIELFDGELERYALRFGDLLVVEGNGSPDQIGRAAMWWDEIPNCVHQNHLIRIRPGSEVEPRYLELVWNAPITADQVQRVASSTSGLHTLSTAKVKAVQIPVPPLDVQKVLVVETERWRSHLDAVRASLHAAWLRSSALRRALLAEAFAGRLVAQDPSDEPASELLARIRAERAAVPKQRRARRAASRAGSRTSKAVPTQQQTLL